MQTRFLIGIPVLLLAENPIGLSVRDVLRRMFSSQLVRDLDLQKFEEILADATRRRDSRLAEIAACCLSTLVTLLR